MRVATGVALLAWTSLAGAQETTLRIATLAPEGSSWMQLFNTFARTIEKHSGGALRLKFKAGATAGDERQVVHKMRLGELDGAAVTPIGLSLIQSEVLLFEMPFFITRADELAHLRRELDGELRKMFLDKGFVLLAWGDVGPVHLFSSVAIGSRADLSRMKVWAWVDDPVVRAVFAELGLPGVPLSLPDVLPSLEKGLINGCYGSPLSVLALRWHAHVKFMVAQPITHAIGAAVVSRRSFDKLAPKLQEMLLNDARELEDQVNAQISGDNVKALASLQRAGLKVIDAPADVLRDFDAAARAVRTKLEGSVYSHAFRMRVEALLESYRAAKTH